MTSSNVLAAQSELAVVLIDNLTLRQKRGILEAVAEAYGVPADQLSLFEALRRRAEIRLAAAALTRDAAPSPAPAGAPEVAKDPTVLEASLLP